MEITTSDAGSAAVVRLDGRLTMVAAPQLRSAVESTVKGETGTRVVVDLGGVTFVDSSGLGALVAGLKTARQNGGDLRIAAAGDQVRTVLGLTNLDRVLRNHATVDEALAGW